MRERKISGYKIRNTSASAFPPVRIITPTVVGGILTISTLLSLAIHLFEKNS